MVVATRTLLLALLLSLAAAARAGSVAREQQQEQQREQEQKQAGVRGAGRRAQVGRVLAVCGLCATIMDSSLAWAVAASGP